MKPTLAYPVPIARPRRPVRMVRPPRAAVDPVEVSRVVGKGLTLWVFFTSALNWMYYRNKR